MVGDLVSKTVLSALNQGKVPLELNETFLVPIPKKKQPEKVQEFWPISLYNSTYKIISKVLANRLKNILLNVISQCQSAFVISRIITDNILLASGAFHSIKMRQRGKCGLMSNKLDMSIYSIKSGEVEVS